MDPFSCILFLLLAFTLAGLAQVAWLKSRVSRRFAQPLDGGRTLRGRRIFGDNKTWRGFLVMVPATAIAFAVLGPLWDVWKLSAPAFAALGAWAGFGFMLAELPNSFGKRQLGVEPGQPPTREPWRSLCFTIDQIDSVAGGLLALACFVPVPTTVWASLLILGLAVHWLFNLLLKQLGMKTRAA